MLYLIVLHSLQELKFRDNPLLESTSVQSIVNAIIRSLLLCFVSFRECSYVHVFYHFEHLSHSVYPHSINVCIIITAASKEPPSVARKLLVTRNNQSQQ